MARVRFDRETLSKAVGRNREGVWRLAHFVSLSQGGTPIPPDLSDSALVERLVRRLDADAMKWPPPVYERKW